MSAFHPFVALAQWQLSTPLQTFAATNCTIRHKKKGSAPLGGAPHVAR